MTTVRVRPSSWAFCMASAHSAGGTRTVLAGTRCLSPMRPHVKGLWISTISLRAARRWGHTVSCPGMGIEKRTQKGRRLVIVRGIGVLALSGLFILGVWVTALATPHITYVGASIMTGMVVILCAREARTRSLVGTVFELGYRIGRRDQAHVSLDNL